MRPKSIATVVVTFSSTPRVSSTPTPAWVIVSSVRSGRISLTEPTRVVLPTPNPPTITIFTAAATDDGSTSSCFGPLRGAAIVSEAIVSEAIVSELSQSIHHLLDQRRIATVCGGKRCAYLHLLPLHH